MHKIDHIIIINSFFTNCCNIGALLLFSFVCSIYLGMDCFYNILNLLKGQRSLRIDIISNPTHNSDKSGNQ